MTDLVTIPCLDDNFAYLVHRNGKTLLIDAPEAAPILAALEQRGWGLDHILITHHHSDHIQAIPEIVAATGARVAGNQSDATRLPPLDDPFQAGDQLNLGGIRIEVIDAPGHTIGHVAFYLPDEGFVFTADSLMAMGCGRLFEGSAEQMWDTLDRLAALPDEVLVCSGHNYLIGNGNFAASVEPDNPAIRQRMENGPASPAPLSLEKATNPFLRVPFLRESLDMQSAPDVEVFARLRKMKDSA